MPTLPRETFHAVTPLMSTEPRIAQAASVPEIVCTWYC